MNANFSPVTMQQNPAKLPPLVRFQRMVPEASLPIAAGKDACGTLPSAALRYCGPATTASAFGWHLSAPVDYRLKFDGENVQWTYLGADRWWSLGDDEAPTYYGDKGNGNVGGMTRGEAESPSNGQRWNLSLIRQVAGFPGLIEMWTGLLIRAAPGWGMLVRPPVNFPPVSGFTVFEGLVDSTHYSIPLNIVGQITRTDIQVELRSNIPLVQVQPIPHALCAGETMRRLEAGGDLTDMEASYWRDLVRYRRDPSVSLADRASARRKLLRDPVWPLLAEGLEGTAF